MFCFIYKKTEDTVALLEKSFLQKAIKICNEDNFRSEIDMILTMFRADPAVNNYSFKNSLTNVERKYIHERCRKLGLKSRSTGQEPNRILTIYKRNTLTDVQYEINLTGHSHNALNTLFHKYSNELECIRLADSLKKYENTSIFGCITDLTPNNLRISRPKMTELRRKSLQLPINVIRESLLKLLETTQVVIITAETGSGKTTQVPQFLLDEAAETGADCRVICTQPRRISTVAVAERVAQERGEKMGETVGYQIKLESVIGQHSRLIYCTTGVLLKTLMHQDTSYMKITHVIIDEIHERDKFTDFLLICLKEYALENPNLRIILMSATMDVELFEKYFAAAQIINVEGRMFEISEYFIEDILQLINYESHRMQRIREAREREMEEQVEIMDESEFNEDMEEVINNCMQGDDDFSQLMQLIVSENISVNYSEHNNGFTPLMAACYQGKSDVVQQLLHMGKYAFYIIAKRVAPLSLPALFEGICCS